MTDTKPQTTISMREVRLEKALKRMIYETTNLSPCEDDGSHKCRISREALHNAREAIREF